MSEDRRRVGVLGGTFNPIHNGHMTMAECALIQYDLDEVLFIPTGHTAYKAYAGADMDAHRCHMVERAIAGEPRYVLSRVELEREDISYTYRTLEELHAADPNASLFFLLGGDSLRDFPTWCHPERICARAVILAAARRELRGEVFDRQVTEIRERFGGDIRFLNMPRFDSSSEEIRARVQRGEDVRDVVPSAVADYIEENGLYR